MKKKITIIDYGAGNILSLEKAIRYIGYKAIISSSYNIISKSDLLFLPGVGAFPQAMNSLKKLNLIEGLKKELQNNKKILGICLGMQLLCKIGTEIKVSKGLSVIDAKVEKLKQIKKIRLPHIGFNKLHKYKAGILLKNIDPQSYFYFNHTYAVKKISNGNVVFTEYGEKFVSLYENKNIFATQFHPEKSQLAGLEVIKNFIES